MYTVRLLDLPHSIKGFVRHNVDGSDTIVLNSRLSRETQEKTMIHELEHIKRDDFYSEKSADDIEMEVRR